MAKRLPGAFSEASLRLTWKMSRDGRGHNPGGPGVDRTTADQFSSHLSAHIHRVRDEIAKQSFRFSPLKPHLLAKGDGYRILAIPTVRDRFVQRAIIRHLDGDTKFSVSTPISFGFRKELGIDDAHVRALDLRREFPWVLKVDIVQFFDRLDRSLLISKIEPIRSKAIKHLLREAVACEIDPRFEKHLLVAEDNGIRNGEGLRQGMPLSPLLSNLMLKEFDTAIHKAGLKAVRYADDIAIFCSSRQACVEALSIIRAKLALLKLSVPDLEDGSKTVIYEPSDVAEFLGLDIKRTATGYELVAPTKKLDKISAKMREVASLGECRKLGRTVSQVSQTLDAMIAGHRGMVTRVANGDDFLKRLVSAKHKAMNSLLRELVGDEVISALTHEKRAVLGWADFEA
ncbi:Group II intron-encoded protein LtrA [compost metagenome]